MLAMVSITHTPDIVVLHANRFGTFQISWYPTEKKYNGSKLGERGGRDPGQHLPKYLTDHFRLNISSTLFQNAEISAPVREIHLIYIKLHILFRRKLMWHPMIKHLSKNEFRVGNSKAYVFPKDRSSITLIHFIRHSEDRASWYSLITKLTRCINFSNLFLE
jgi:hypothetical protein